MTSSCLIKNCHQITLGLHYGLLSQKAWNRKNVLKNILLLAKLTTWSIPAHQVTKDNTCFKWNMPYNLLMKWAWSLKPSINRRTTQWYLQELSHKEFNLSFSKWILPQHSKALQQQSKLHNLSLYFSVSYSLEFVFVKSLLFEMFFLTKTNHHTKCSLDLKSIRISSLR